MENCFPNFSTHSFHCLFISVVTIPDFAMRYISRYLFSQCLDLQFVYDGNAIYRPRGTFYSITTIGAECAVA